jgi:hypothetical protein
MLEASRRNMDYADTVRVLNDDTGLYFFEQITKEDIMANGKIVPMGARHYAETVRSFLWVLVITQNVLTVYKT